MKDDRELIFNTVGSQPPLEYMISMPGKQKQSLVRVGDRVVGGGRVVRVGRTVRRYGGYRVDGRRERTREGDRDRRRRE